MKKCIIFVFFLIILITSLFVIYFINKFEEVPILEWNASNGCVYQLLRNPQYLNTSNVQNVRWKFQLFKKHKNIYTYNFFDSGILQVRCPSKTAFCDKTDSVYKRIWMYLSENGENCDNYMLYDIWRGILLSIPFEKTWGNDNVIVGCDFVEKKNEDNHDASGLFILNNKGSCPIWLKSKENLKEYDLYILDIEKKGSTFKIEPSKPMTIYPNKHHYSYTYPLAIKSCKNSICDAISIIPDPNRKWSYTPRKNLEEIKIKCDYMHLKSNSDKNITATLEIKAEGVCPIEINNDSGKTDTVYVRSIKTSDGYKALISTRDSYIKELKMNKNR